MENKSNQGFLEKVFHLSENHTDVRTGVVAGITAFMTMAYIFTINPDILSAMRMDRGATFTAVALASLVATLLMAAFADYLFVLVPGMGLNAYPVYTVALQVGYTWQMALAAVFVEGLIFVVLSPTNVYETIFNAIPMNLKHAVSAGIGPFAVFIGLQDAKTMAKSTTFVSMSSSKGSLDTGTFNSIEITVLLALIDVLITGILVVRSVKGNILWDILITQVLGIICEVIGLYQPNVELGMFSMLPDFSSGFGIQSIAPTSFKMDFSGVLPLNFVTIMFAFPLVDMFDTLGALVSVASKVDILDKDEELPKIRDALLSDIISTSLGAVFSTSTTTTLVESAPSVTEDRGIGLTSVVAAMFPGLSLLLSPISPAISSSVVAPALIIVGFLMIGSALKVDFNDFIEAIPSYIAIIAMPFMYSTSEGIATGVISYAVINIVTGHAKEKKTSLLTYILVILFVPKYVLI